MVIIPIGHTEQHGHHLPLSTDTLIIDAIAQGVVEAVPDQAARLPVMPYGVSTHRQAFAGTLNAGGRAFEDFWLGVIDVLAGRGFDRMYLISGHGGNCSFLVNVVSTLAKDTGGFSAPRPGFTSQVPREWLLCRKSAPRILEGWATPASWKHL